MPSAERKPFVICVVGPTASGKTALADALAQELSGFVLSADSMQIYRGMDIGTGKIKPADRHVDYFGLNLEDPGTPYSAALFQNYGRNVIDDNADRQAVVCGGTGLYISALVEDFRFPAGEQIGNPVRDRYMQYAAEHGNQALWNLLNEADPQSAQLIHANNVKRVVRAFEMLDDGTSYARQQAGFAQKKPWYDSLQIGLQVDPDILRRRIDVRVDDMFSDGLVDEVEALLKKGFREALTAGAAIGYKEIVAAIDGEYSMAEAREQIKIATHRYAKRQRTWFRRNKDIRWIGADSLNVGQQLDESLQLLDKITPLPITR